MFLLVYEAVAYGQDTIPAGSSVVDIINIFTNLGGIGAFAYLIYKTVEKEMKALNEEVKGIRADLKSAHEDFSKAARENGEHLVVIRDRVNRNDTQT